MGSVHRHSKQAGYISFPASKRSGMQGCRQVFGPGFQIPNIEFESQVVCPAPPPRLGIQDSDPKIWDVHALASGETGM